MPRITTSSSSKRRRSPIPENKQAELARELENYAQTYFRYTKLVQDQADAMRHDSKEKDAAYARVAALEAEPWAVRVCKSFASSFYLQLLLLGYLKAPGRSPEDPDTVFNRGCQLLREYYSGQSSEIPTVAPPIVKLIPQNPITRPVLPQDIELWTSQPKELVGIGFISKEMLRRVFVVDDYYVKRTGPQYDVLCEDTGLEDVQAIDPETLLNMMTEAELVMNMQPLNLFSLTVFFVNLPTVCQVGGIGKPKKPKAALFLKICGTRSNSGSMRQ